MTTQPVEANVVLTADNSGYDQAMGQSTQSTNTLGASIDQLTSKISKMTKTAGKSLIGIAAGDIALIGGATKAWNDYEKQMERLRSQAAVLGRNTAEQNKIMKDYTNSVKTLRNEFGTTTAEAAKLNEVLSKVTSQRQSRDLTDLSKIFIEMSGATGESSEGLANSLTNLQKVMGTPINAQNTRKYADTFTYLAAQTNTSAQGLIDFTAQLAPVAESLGMNTKQVAGFATAFTQAGQEGGAAANAFTKVTGDMLKSIQSGSPELATYANIVGTTAGEFKKLAKDDSAEAVIRVFEALSKNTRGATADLNRLGLDGPRTIRSITALMNQPGGIRAAFGMAEEPRQAGATQRGYQATMKGLSDESAKLGEDLKSIAEAFATYLGPAIEGFLKGMEKAASLLQSIVEGPIGKFLQVVMGFIAPLAGGAGALLLFAGALIKVAGAFTLLNNSMSKGVREGFRGGTGIERTADGSYIARGGGPMGRTGQALLAGAQPGVPYDQRSTWVQRGLYNTGILGGQALGSLRSGGAAGESWYATREALSAKIPWTQQYVRPEGPGRGPLSYVAGGLGRGIQQFVTPTFDQMRYTSDPTRRMRWAEQEAPWIRGADKAQLLGGRTGLISAMGRVGLAETQLAAQRAETVKVHADPLMTEQMREARLTELRQMREETMQRRSAAQAQETAVRKEIAARDTVGKAMESTTVGTQRLGEALRGLGRNVGGSIFGRQGALVQGGGAFLRSGMAGPTLAMGTMAGASMLGVESNALMGAATGAMIGSMLPGPGTAIGAAVGGAIGLATDFAHANDDVTESLKGLNEQAAETSTTGSGIDSLSKATDQSQKDLNKWTESIGASGDQMDFWLGAPKWEYVSKAIPSVKNAIEGLFGKSDVEEAQEDLDKTKEKTQAVEGAARDLAKAGGATLSGTAANQRKQLDEFMASRGMAALGEAGVDLETLVAARQKGSESSQYQQLLQQVSMPGMASGMWERLRTTQAGAAMLDTPVARRALRQEGNIALQYDAVNQVFNNMRESGMSLLDIVRSTEKAQQKIGVEGGPEYAQMMALSGKAQYALQMQAPQLGRMGAFQQQLQLGQTLMGIKPRTEEQATQLEQQKQVTAQAIADNDQYFRQLILAQEAYDRQRARAQEDFNLQRQYQDFDYNLQRERAEENFNRMRNRAVADYHRGVTRAWSDFHLQRRRQEEDYRHQIDVTAQQQAVSMNLYQRTPTQRTSSATWLMANTEDILKNLREQKQNLNKLRDLGISDAVIQQLQLTDPANAQQLSRFVIELQSDQSNVGRFNRTARQLTRASRDLVTDESSLTFKEQQRTFRLGRERGLDDMNRSMDRQQNDFRRGLRQQRDDFNIMMDQQAEDYERSQRRQLKAYKTSMDRSAEDMAHMADEVTGSITDVLIKAHQKLTGSAKTQAGIALQSFKDLRSSTKPEAVALMKELSTIFGFDYTAPKGVHMGGGGGGPSAFTPGGHVIGETENALGQRATSSYAPYHNPGLTGSQGNPYYAGGSGLHEGGVIPGWTPGRDTTHIAVGGGEAVMRPEWTRAVGGRRVVEAWNHAAKYGGSNPRLQQHTEQGFAGGGVVNPDARVYMDGEPLSKIAAAQVLLAERLGRLNISIMQGSWQPQTSYSGTSHMGPGVLDASPGNFTTQYWLRRVGFAAWGRNFAGAATAGSGAHVHAVSRLDPGAAGHAQLSSFARGEDGLGGQDYGPDPPLEPGLMDMLARFGALAVSAGGGTGAAGVPGAGMTRHQIAQQILKRRYHRAEQAAAGMGGVHPLEPGMISTIINRYARRKIGQAMRRYGAPGAAGGAAGGGAGGLSLATPAGVESNEDAVRRASAQMGWGSQWPQLHEIVMHESGFRNTAQNPSSSAYGMFQFLDGTWNTVGGHKTSDPWLQAVYGMKYIKQRYHDPKGAWDFWQSHNWYANGAMFDRPNVIGVGERGPEAVIPLNDKGGEFLARSIGLTTMAGGGRDINVNNFKIDRSTNFTGPITVQANDPNEMLARLQARQRVRALSRPSLTGTAA
jgi:TP901 family phage tail tape measure protein